jgi:Ca2+-binding RTX toxin-like protein
MQMVPTDGDDIIKWLEDPLDIDTKAGDDKINTGTGDDILRGGDGDDTIHSGSGDDTIYGGSGDDFIDAEQGDDSIYAGSGNDTLEGNSGDDTYFFSRADNSSLGTNLIIESQDINNNDKIVFDHTIGFSDIIIKMDQSSPNDMILTLKDTNPPQTITIKDWVLAEGTVEFFEFYNVND